MIIADEILEFWKKYGYYDYPQEILLEAINKHLEFKTIEYVKLKNQIVALARWNVEEDTAHILDCVVRPDFKNKRLIKLMLLRGWKQFPYVKKIRYQRGIFGDERWKEFTIERFLGVKNVKQNTAYASNTHSANSKSDGGRICKGFTHLLSGCFTI